MVLIHTLVCVALATGALAASSWDEFSNNFATDLAPILQLFGDQATKQYLAESTCILDCVIFAMAPLGILTAVVSVIRVCGQPFLRAFIGRAQEGSGIAELELCSSTGRDIAELYQGGAITRVFGRAKILEFIHVPQYETRYSNLDQAATAGIYTFVQFLAERKGRSGWRSSKPGSTEDQWSGYTVNPNLMLNVGLRRPTQQLLIFTAVLGVLLQASMLGFAVWITHVKKLQETDVLPPPWALPMTAIGTTLLCAGMFMCSHLIERSTKERTFDRALFNDSESGETHTMYWVQPGDQVIGDQTFDSFAYSDKGRPLSHYTTSWRRPVKPWERKMALVATVVTMAGFILQFIGLRGVHSAVSVYQIVAVLIMSIVRASLRTKRIDTQDNL
ncbi:uncharacterized protein K460DRAFT_289144, partial [Cucurbitaria berberidis CBS 394.84]